MAEKKRIIVKPYTVPGRHVPSHHVSGHYKTVKGGTSDDGRTKFLKLLALEEIKTLEGKIRSYKNRNSSKIAQEKIGQYKTLVKNYNIRFNENYKPQSFSL